MKLLYRWNNARHIAALYEAAEIFNIVHKTKWVRMPNIINITMPGAACARWDGR